MNLRLATPEPDQRGRGEKEAAFHDLVDRHAAEMFRLAVALVGNAADAEDVVQDALAGALRGWEAFEGRSSARTWLTRIVMNQAARRRRDRKRRRMLSLSPTDDGARETPRRSEPATAPPRVDVQMDVRAALDALSPEHREIVVLREYQGMSYDEIAEVLDVPRGTVESRLFRARQELKARLSAYLTQGKNHG